MALASRDDRVERGDSRIQSVGNPALTASGAAAQQASIANYDQKVATDLNIPLSAISPQVISDYEAIQNARSQAGGFFGTLSQYMPAIAAGILTAGIAAPAAAGLAGTLGTTGATVAGGALQGVASGALGSALSGGDIGKGALMGGLGGGISGGIGASGITGTANQYLVDAGVNPTVAAGLVKGTIGAGTGALSGAISGGDPGRSALIGGVGGLASGALGQLSGNSTLGKIGGTIAGGIANQLTQPSAPQQPTTAPSVPSATTSQPTIMPTLPGSAPAAGTQNIGSYSGYGYAPRTQVANPVQDYAHYGAGPEAQFYTTNTGVTAPTASNSATTAAPVAPSFANPPTMSTIQNNGITPQNSV